MTASFVMGSGFYVHRMFTCLCMNGCWRPPAPDFSMCIASLAGTRQQFEKLKRNRFQQYQYLACPHCCAPHLLLLLHCVR